MPDYRRASCKRCGKHRDRVGPISWRGNCRKCAILAVNENIDGLHEMKGEPLRRWRLGMVRAAYGRDLDEALFGGQTRD